MPKSKKKKRSPQIVLYTSDEFKVDALEATKLIPGLTLSEFCRIAIREKAQEVKARVAAGETVGVTL